MVCDQLYPTSQDFTQKSAREAVFQRRAAIAKCAPHCQAAWSVALSRGTAERGSRLDGAGGQEGVDSWKAQRLKCAEQPDRHPVKIFEAMREEGVELTSNTFVHLLKDCSRIQDLKAVKQIHAEAVRCGWDADSYVGTMLVDAYAKCGSVENARRVFESLPHRDVVPWTAMISAYAHKENAQEAFRLYAQMQQEGVVPNARTYVCILKACSSIGSRTKEQCLETVAAIHADVKQRKLENDVFVGTMLVDAYARCGDLESARQVFEDIPHRDVVSWNSMILRYSQMEQGEEALVLYNRMRQEGVLPDDRTYVGVLKACSSIAELIETAGGDSLLERRRCLDTVSSIHADIRRKRLELDVFVGTMLVDAYAKCGSLETARQVFETMVHRDVVSWTAMIVGYARMDKGEEALKLYRRMQHEGVIPNDRTYVGAINACSSMAGLETGKEVHSQILRSGIDPDCFMSNSLIDMYSKCSSMLDAQRVFDAMPSKDHVTWNALISGYARQGESGVVFNLFERMQQEGVQPNDVTFLAVLNVCNHVGLLDSGHIYFSAMSRDYGVSPTLQHYSCMVDLLGRAGQVDRAMGLVKMMPFEPDSTVWKCILGACQKWENVELGRQAFECALKVDKSDAAVYVLMSNIFTAAHMPKEAKRVQAARMKSGAWKEPGRSQWMDMSGTSHVFVVGDREHPESKNIYSKLRHLLVKLEQQGYLHSSIMHDT